MLLLSALLTLTPAIAAEDSLKTFEIPKVVVSAPIKHNGRFEEEPLAVSTFDTDFLEEKRIGGTTDISLVTPNFFQPDYGSKMTSSIYVRGIGARMDQPSVGLYVDNIPILNKNNYDIDYYDLANLYMLRGPQGTLYGRNTIGGVIDIYTISPLSYQGTRIHAGYGNGNTFEVRASTYHKLSDNLGIGIAFSHRYSDGFFTNSYDGTSADRILSEGGRIKIAYRLGNRWTMENTLFSNYVKQKGFPYSLYNTETGAVSPINHNDPCSYERLNITDGLTFRHDGLRFSFSSTTSYQYTNDDMLLDQDFTSEALFTLRQKQKENAITQEFVLRSNDNSRWQSTSGLFGFYKGVDMYAPVNLKSDGIKQLILEPANKGIQMIFPGKELLIENNTIPINSSFELPVYGVSAYHQSSYTTRHWTFTAGVRLDYEHSAIRYDSRSSLNYLFTLNMNDYKNLPVDLKGKNDESWLEFMPKASVSYTLGSGIIYASVSRGYKSGGFNTQMFSDILQGRLTSELMRALGFPHGSSGSETDILKTISYKPEYSWNYEIGGHLEFFDERLRLDMALFYIDLRDQQLTVFPDGEQTGRMMSNAGRSRSMGAELSASYTHNNFDITASYGYTHARFMKYVMEGKDYSNKYVPYIPQNTLSFMAGYRIKTGHDTNNNIILNLGWQGAGRIYWNEANTARQKFYGLLSASVKLDTGKLSYTLWSSNLTGTEYNTFYFMSMERSFVQRGKPRLFGVSVDIKL